MSADTRSSASLEGDASVRATFEVDPGPGVNCPVANRVPNAPSVTQTLATVDGEDTCQTELTVVEDDAPKPIYLSEPTPDRCICSTLAEHECVWSLDRIRDGSLLISVTVRDRSLLEDLVAAIRETGASVSVRRIVDFEDASGTIELDATAITPTQRETVELAVERGYYDQPRRGSLEDLADALGISRSAVSQRLNAAETRLVRSLVPEG